MMLTYLPCSYRTFDIKAPCKQGHHAFRGFAPLAPLSSQYTLTYLMKPITAPPSPASFPHPLDLICYFSSEQMTYSPLTVQRQDRPDLTPKRTVNFLEG